MYRDHDCSQCGLLVSYETARIGSIHRCTRCGNQFRLPSKSLRTAAGKMAETATGMTCLAAFWVYRSIPKNAPLRRVASVLGFC